jgi:hypothetical protein
MSFTVAAVIAVGVGAAKAIDGGIKAKKAKEDAKEAQKELDKHKQAFSQLDTSNPYANMENAMEDLTVNTQQAEFQAEQSAQNRANVMQQMKGSAGGSGIAALAQSMANQGSLDIQRQSASIGQQENRNQQAMTREASRIQTQERQGEIMSRNMEKGKVESLMGMSADEVAVHRKAQADATAQMWDGISDAGSAVGGMSFGGGTGVDPGVLEDQWANADTNLTFDEWAKTQ